MSAIIAYCGINCVECPAYIATQANDRPAQEKLLAEWRVLYNSPEMPFEAVICDGCNSGRCGGYCSECPIRACAVERSLTTCADCPEYSCEKLSNFVAAVPSAHANLEALRASKN